MSIPTSSKQSESSVADGSAPDLVERYHRSRQGFLEARRRCADDLERLKSQRRSAFDRSRDLGRTFVFFGVVFAVLAGLAVREASNTDFDIMPLSTGLAYLLSGASIMLFAAAVTLRYAATGAALAVLTRGNGTMAHRRRWLEALADLASNRSGRVADDVRTKAEGHLRADDVLTRQYERRLTWPARSSIFSSSDFAGHRFPFAVDLARWISSFAFAFATLLLIPTTLLGHAEGMAANGLALVIAAGVRLVTTNFALAARQQRLTWAMHHHNLRSVVVGQDDALLAEADDLTVPVISLDPEVQTITSTSN